MTVAVRGRRSMSAISPNAEPGPIVATSSPWTSTLSLAALDDEEHEPALALERDLVARPRTAAR